MMISRFPQPNANNLCVYLPGLIRLLDSLVLYIGLLISHQSGNTVGGPAVDGIVLNGQAGPCKVCLYTGEYQLSDLTPHLPTLYYQNLLHSV